MAVDYVKELWPGRSASDDIEKRTQLTHVYEVRTTDPLDDAAVAGDTILLPRLGDQHPTYPAAYVVSVDPQQHDEDPTLWHVTIRYSSELPNRSGTGGSGIALGPGPESQGIDDTGEPVNNSSPAQREVSPVNRPAVWRRTCVEVDQPFVWDRNEDPVLNSAGLPFDPPAMTRYRYILVTIVKNISGISNDTIMSYIDHTNDAPWKGIDTGKALIVGFDTASDFENDIPFTQVTLSVAVSYKSWGWKKRIIDRGFYRVVNPGGLDEDWERIRDPKTGFPRTEPSLLNGAGDLLPIGDPTFPIEFDEFLEADYGVLMGILGIS